MTSRRPLARHAGLLIVSFIATLAVLAGLLSVATGRERPGNSPSGIAVVPGLAASGLTPSDVASAPPELAGDPVLVGAGDIADCDSPASAETAKLIEGIAGNVFTAGDNAYPNGTADQFAQCYDPTWGQFKARTRPAAGNHDYQTKGAAGYLGYFGSAATNKDGKTWYSYDLGRWHVLVLDANCTEVEVGGCGTASPQGQWLTADLAASKARCTVAIWHQPRFSSGVHGNDLAVSPFWDALYAAGVDVVINGHDRDYERFKPQTPSGATDLERGIREFVVGTGGEALRVFGIDKPNSDIRAAVDHGVLKLTLHPTGYDWAFVSVTGIFSDSGSAACH
jgi:acid phosphatase type 7